MRCFALNCIYPVTCGRGKHVQQVNKPIHLIQAKRSRQALPKANLNALGLSSVLSNRKGDRIVWKFLGAVGLAEVAGFTDVAAVGSGIVESKPASLYLKKLTHRNKSLIKRTHRDN